MTHTILKSDCSLERRGAIVHSSLDDSGLSLYQHRVYCHLLRRAGSKSYCYPSVPSIADCCRCSTRKVQKVLKELSDLGFIQRAFRIGQFGSRTSDLITILGIPPGVRGAPPLAHAVRHPGAPGAHEGIPEEGIPKNTRSGVTSLKDQSRVTSEFTPETRAQAQSLTNLYFQCFSFSKSPKARLRCVHCFAAAIEACAGFFSRTENYLTTILSLTASARQEERRAGRLPSQETKPWELIAYLKKKPSSISQPFLASQLPALQARMLRFLDSQNPHSIQQQDQGSSDLSTPQSAYLEKT